MTSGRSPSAGEPGEPSAEERNVERLLRRAWHPGEPEAAFAAELARRMRQEAACQAARRRRPVRLMLWRARWAAAGLGAAVAAAGILGLVGTRGPGGGQPRQTAPAPALQAAVGPDGLAGTSRLVAVPAPPALPSAPAAAGTTIATGPTERRRVTLDDGSTLYVNSNATVTVVASRRLRLAAGQVYVEAAPAGGGPPFVVDAPGRTIRSEGTRFAASAAEGQTGVLVTQGAVRVSGWPEPLEAGRELAPGADRPAPMPRASAVLDWTRDLMAAGREPLVPPSPCAGGALVARGDGGGAIDLEMRRYHIDVHIEDGFARTTIDQTYFNHTTARLEGTFYFPLPADASLSRLAMYVNGRLMEGGMVERDRAAEIYESIVRSMRDPALLEWVDGTTFRMRVFPIEPRQEKRIMLSYTQRLADLYGRTTYRFAAGHTMKAVARWSLHVRVRRGARVSWRCDSHALAERREGDDLLLDAGAAGAPLDRDVMLELSPQAAPAEQAPPPAFASAADETGRYLMVRLRPQLPSQPRRQRRHWVVLFESSADRDPLLARTQIEIVRDLLSAAEHDDTFCVVTAGATSRAMAEFPLPATADNVQRAVAFLESAHLVGALDLDAALSAAGALAARGSQAHVVHLGSGVAVLGRRDPAALVGRLPGGVRYVGVAVGKRWDRAFMKAAAARSGGYFTQINPDENIAWRTFDLVSTLNTPRLLDVRVRDGAARELLCLADSAAHGEQVCAIWRGERDAEPPRVLVASGMLDGRPWSQTLSVSHVVAAADYLPRTWARLEIDRLGAEGGEGARRQIIDLSKSMYAISPYTSLLVLESEEMYREHNVDRGRKDRWAAYPCPAEIPVVVEPLKGPPPAAPPPAPAIRRRAATTRPAWDEAILRTILVRLPAPFFQGAGEPVAGGGFDPHRSDLVTAWDALSPAAPPARTILPGDELEISSAGLLGQRAFGPVRATVDRRGTVYLPELDVLLPAAGRTAADLRDLLAREFWRDLGAAADITVRVVTDRPPVAAVAAAIVGGAEPPPGSGLDAGQTGGAGRWAPAAPHLDAMRPAPAAQPSPHAGGPWFAYILRREAWEELAGARPAANELPGLTKEEAAEMRKLQMRMPRTKLADTPLSDVLAFVKEMTGANIHVAWRALEAAGINKTTPVTMDLSGVTADQLLRLVLHDVSGAVAGAEPELDYAVSGSVVTVTTRADLAGHPVRRLYDVRDLLIAPAAGAAADAADARDRQAIERELHMRDLVDLLRRGVDRESWMDPAGGGGGTGSVQPFRDLLVVTQTAENHRAIRDLLGTLRGARGLDPNGTGPAAAPAELAARARLRRRIEHLKLDKIDLKEAFNFLREYSNQSVHANWRALAAAGVEPTTKVSIDVRGVTVGRALELVLRDASGAAAGADAELTYALDGGLLTISTKADLARKPVRRIYDVSDLIAPDPNRPDARVRDVLRRLSGQQDAAEAGGVGGGTFGGGLGGGIFGGGEMDSFDMARGTHDAWGRGAGVGGPVSGGADGQGLVDIIRRGVDRDSWADAGGRYGGPPDQPGRLDGQAPSLLRPAQLTGLLAAGLLRREGGNTFGSPEAGRHMQLMGGRLVAVQNAVAHRELADLIARLRAAVRRGGRWGADFDANTPASRPAFSGHEGYFTDLTLYAPGLNTTAADIRTLLDAEAPPDRRARQGRIDPAAAALIDAARPAGWRHVELPAADGGPAGVTFDGRGRCVVERRVGGVLAERIVCDGETLLHVYGEIGLAARRRMGRFLRAGLPAVPWLVPPAADLAAGADVLAVGPRTVAVRPLATGATAGPTNEMRLTFAADGRLEDRSVLRASDGAVLARQTYAADGTVRYLDAAGKLLAERTYNARPADEPELRPDLAGLVVLPMPLRDRPARPAGPVDAWPEGEALAWAAARLLRQGDWLRRQGVQAIEKRFLARGDRRAGLYVLLAAAGQRPALPDELASRPLGQYLAAAELPAAGGQDEGLAARLAGFRALWKRTDRGGPARPQWVRDALAYAGRGDPSIFGWAVLAEAARLAGRADQPALAAAFARFESFGPLRGAAAYESARALHLAGRDADAADKYLHAARGDLAAGRLPAIDPALHAALAARGRWGDFVASAAAALLDAGAVESAVRLAWRCLAVGDANAGADVMAKPAQRAGEARRLPLALAALQYHWQAQQWDRAEKVLAGLLADERLAGEPDLWRLAARIARERQDLPAVAARLDRAADLDYARLRQVVRMDALRDDYAEVLAAWRGAAGAIPPQKRHDAARAVVRAADRWRRLDPGCPATCRLAAAALDALGQDGLAWDYATTTLAAVGSGVEHWLAAAAELADGGQRDLAERLYAAAEAAWPDDPRAPLERAKLLVARGRRDAAEPLLRRVLEISRRRGLSDVWLDASRLLLTGQP